MAGAERGYSGYPTFNAPEHLAVDLKELGVDIMTTANNHSLDKGFSGLTSTLGFLDDAGIAHVGTARTEEEQNTSFITDLNGIKTAFIAYTYGTNGIPAPKGKEFCINLIDEDLILNQINQAKSEGAELIVASMHWGVEYQTTENEEQNRLAEFLISNDVKVILGSHPHVIQPMKMLKVQTDDGEKEIGNGAHADAGEVQSDDREEHQQVKYQLACSEGDARLGGDSQREGGTRVRPKPDGLEHRHADPDYDQADGQNRCPAPHAGPCKIRGNGFHVKRSSFW